MAVSKLSQISPGPVAGINDQLVGVKTGTTDTLYSLGNTLTVTGNQIEALPFPWPGGVITYYVATTGSDSNPGTLAQPFATLQRAANVVSQFDYGQNPGNVVIIQVEDGTYNLAFTITVDPLINNTSAFNSIHGNSNNPQNVVLSLATDDIIHFRTNYIFNFSNYWNFYGFHLVSTNSGGIFFEGGILIDDIIFECRGTQCIGSGPLADHEGSIDNSLLQIANPIAANSFFLDHCSFLFSGYTLVFPATGYHNGSLFQPHGTESDILINAPTFVNAGTVTGASVVMVESSIYQGDPFQTGTYVDPSSLPGSGTLEAVSQSLIASENLNFSLTAVPQALPPIDFQDLYKGTYGFFKATTSGVRGLFWNDATNIYCKQISRTINHQTAGVGYTLALTDYDGRVEMDYAGGNTLTVPTHASVKFPVTAEILITQVGAGATTVAAAGGVTVHNAGALSGQWASVRLYQRATDEWVMTGA